MAKKRASIVVDLRTGQHVVNVPDIMTVLAAAGWKPEVALKEYSGQTIKVAKKVSGPDIDLMIGYGGDGTLNGVINGLMVTGEKSVIADIPGGTYNEWAGTVGVPDDPVKAALTIINSEPRRVDIGHIEVQGIMLPGLDGQPGREIEQKPKKASSSRQYFFLHTGMGIDSVVMAHISKPLKYRIGRFAFDVAALKELPQIHTFPTEIQVLDKKGNVLEQWEGKAWQVIVSKTRMYAGVVDVAPNAYLDDGMLNVCVITADNAVKSLEQMISMVARHRLDSSSSKMFQGAHILVRMPASIGMQVDGSVIKLDDFLRKEERDALKGAELQQVMVMYRFDAIPAAVQMAIPRGYEGKLFKNVLSESSSNTTAEQQVPHIADPRSAEECKQHFESLHKQGYKMKVVGVVPHPTKKDTYIVAGKYTKPDDEQVELLAARINTRCILLNENGEQLPLTAVSALQEGAEFLVDGDKNSRGVVKAKCAMLFS